MDSFDKKVIAVMSAFLVAVLVLLAWALFAYDESMKEWEQACRDAGGHVLTTTSTGVNPQNGQPVVVTNHTCLSSDGRILEV